MYCKIHCNVCALYIEDSNNLFFKNVEVFGLWTLDCCVKLHLQLDLYATLKYLPST